MNRVEIKFNHGNIKVRFIVKHNLEEYGLNIEDALTNWLVRTDEYTSKSFCDYVVSKNPLNLICEVV